MVCHLLCTVRGGVPVRKRHVSEKRRLSVRGCSREGAEAASPKGRRKAPSRLRPLTGMKPSSVSAFMLLLCCRFNP